MAGTSPAMTLHVWFDLTETRSRANFVPMKSHSRVIARESGRSSNPGDAAEYWIPAFAGMTLQSW